MFQQEDEYQGVSYSYRNYAQEINLLKGTNPKKREKKIGIQIRTTPVVISLIKL